MESLIVSVDRLEGILLEYAPDIAAEVLSRVWPIAKPSKPTRKAKYPPVPVHETRPKAVWEQRCYRCAREMKAGETAYAGVECPATVCAECEHTPLLNDFGQELKRQDTCEVVVVAA